MSPCLTCGHRILVHYPNNEPCITPGCTCTKYEGAPATTPTAVAAPVPDLQQAIHAATKALIVTSAAGGFPLSNRMMDGQAIARVAVEAAWPVMAVQLQAAHAENQQLREERTAVVDPNTPSGQAEILRTAAGFYPLQTVVADAMVAGAQALEQLQAAQAERDQLSRDASDARRQLGIARATVIRLDTELQAAQAENQQLRDLVGTVRGHDCSTRWRPPCTHEMAILATLEQQAAPGQVDQ